MTEVRICIICKTNPIVRRRNLNGWWEDRYGWVRRKTCDDPVCKKAMRSLSQSVAGKLRRNNTESRLPKSKQCPICDVAFCRRAGELVQNWLSRKTCCTEHQYLLQSLTKKQQHFRDEGIKLDATTPEDYGAGFHSQNTDPGDGGPIRLSKPDYQTYGGVGRW